MPFETLRALEDHAAPDPGPLARALAAQERESAREAAEQERADAERQAAREERAEGLAIMDRSLGGALGQISAARSAMAQADDEIAELNAKLRRLEARRSRAEGNMKWWAQRAQSAQDCAQRSVPTVTGGPDLLAGAKQAHREYVQASRAAWNRATAPRPPSVSRGAAAAAGEDDAAPYPPGAVITTAYAPPGGVSWSQLSDWISRGWRP